MLALSSIHDLWLFSRRPLAFKDSPCLPSLLCPSFYGDTRWVSTRNDPLNAGTFHSVEAIAPAAALFMAAIHAFIISLLLPFWSRLQFSDLTWVALFLRASAECKALSFTFISFIWMDCFQTHPTILHPPLFHLPFLHPSF